MHHLGNFSLMAVVVLCAYGVVASLLGARQQAATGSTRLVTSARRALVAAAAFSALSVAALLALFLADDFRFQYVASYSAAALPLPYKVSALWAGNDGSLLFWTFLMLVFSAAVVILRKNDELIPQVVTTLSGVVLFFAYMNYWVCNPFGQLAEITAAGPVPFLPADGNGLNPLLQHPIMAIHPPILYTGFVGFVVPFAFCVAALWTRRLDAAWIANTRRWTLVAWFFLGSGILLGGRWAYVELGWGGYWGWDPVENAALMPWLTGTAFLHSVMIQERKGMLKIWNAGLVMATYLLCVFGTFLTRSGIVSSVHAFASSEFAWRFLLFIAAAAALSAALLISRVRDLRSENELESVVSRESGFLFNNLLLLAACFAVFWGTLFPVLSEAVQGEQITVGAPFFNRVNVPLGLALLLMTGVGPLLAWRRSSLDSLRRNFILPGSSGLLTGLVLFLFGVRHPYALVCFAMGAFVTVTITSEFHRGVRARRAHRGGGYGAALADLVLRNTRRYGGYVVHLGIVLLFLGFAGNAFNRDVIADLNPGETTRIGPYSVTLQDLPGGATPVYDWLGAQLLLSKHDEPIGIFQPRRQLDLATGQATSEVRRHATFQEDIYLVFSGMTDDGRATIHVYRNPLVRWVWIGGLVMFLGTLLTLLPGRLEARAAGRPLRAAARPPAGRPPSGLEAAGASPQ